MDSLFMFSGTGGAMAYSMDESGQNLPTRFRPWRFCRQVSTLGPTFKVGSDRRALEEVEAKGFSVVVITIKLEPRSTLMRITAPPTIQGAQR
jgi:hypothetical protein